MSTALHVLVIGNGMVSYKFCEKLRKKAEKETIRISVIGEELNPAYDRVHLSDYFSERKAESLAMATSDWYVEQGIDLLCGVRVTDINRKDKKVVTDQGHSYAYDTLIIATGSYPFVPPIFNEEKKGVFVYRTIDDLDAIMDYGKKMIDEGKKVGGVLGGGLLGLEAAKALKDLGLNPHVVEYAERLMPRQLDSSGASILREILQEKEIEIHTGKNTTEVCGNGSISGLDFQDGSHVDLDMLVISAGIRARDELGKKSGLVIGEKGGIVVDQFMRTSDPAIYAIGEVACYQEKTYGLVAPGYEMAEVASSHIVGEEKSMSSEVDMSTKLKLIGVDVASFGDPFTVSSEDREISIEDRFSQVYKKIIVSADGKKLKGGILVGDAEDYNKLFQLYINNMDIPQPPESLIISSSGQEASSSVLDFPDDALICSCESITKGTLCNAVLEEGNHSLKKLCAATQAGTGCGGCKPMVENILQELLIQSGKTIKEEICEHFPIPRRELYDLIKLKGISDYDEALDVIGKGDGCEVCKPALASIFAALYAETAVAQPTIQDTNDRFLANIQRNGSYSVVPRVPGGEITPDKLIVIGQVAKKYDLYTKITGGQRVDLFGAKVEDLPSIWEELILAGFESGHAYGKALRTVKSCVGSTWCRYGLDESVSFAIELENRYKGIRSPHKLKGGVSGCIRECAEARCKDFGLIATENGWNLYICGNGGANPKHAQLLAENIDNDTVIKYLDRFLMYYIKTAAPLKRTAAWLENLDGGIAYVREVVVEDILGIGDQLEAEMKTLVAGYKCEWKEVVENEHLRKRFKPFINTEEKDESVNFVKMRDQKMPAPWK